MAALAKLSDERLFSLSGYMVRRTYEQGELIFLEGDPAAGIWFILEGRVRIIKQSLSGRTQVLCMADSGKCFGSCPLFNGQNNPANAQALEPVTLVVLPTEESQRLMKDDPALLWALVEVYSSRLQQLARLSESLGAWSVGARINDCLLSQANGDVQPIIEITHEKLADMTGTVREVVSRHLAKLEGQGILSIEAGRITIRQREALEMMCILDM